MKRTRRCARTGRGERGFLMVEAVIAVALVALCIGTVMGAVVMVQHQTVTELPAAGLTLSAQNVLTDLRAATAYDGAQLADLVGRSTEFDVREPVPQGTPQPLHVSVRVDRSDAGGAVVATVTVRNVRGRSASVQSTLVHEAPAPGSVVEASPQAADDAAAAPSAGGTSR